MPEKKRPAGDTRPAFYSARCNTLAYLPWFLLSEEPLSPCCICERISLAA